MSTAPPPPPEGDVDKGDMIIAITAVIVGLTAIIVALRMAVRIWITKSLWWDDWTILLAILGNVIGAGLDFVEVHYGFGRPEAYLSKWQIIEFRKYTYGEWIQTFATLMWTKISICCFLLRIPVTKGLILPLQIAIGFLLVSNIILTILWIVQCRPISATWNPDVEGTCFGKGQLERIIISQAIISAVSDYVFSAYPVLILWNIQMTLRHKAALCCLMGVGVFTGACCIVRTVLNFQSIPKDVTYGGITNWVWRTFEVQLGIIAACTPALVPGYRWVKEAIRQRGRPKHHEQLTDELGLQRVDFSTKKSTLPVHKPSASSISDSSDLYHAV